MEVVDDGGTILRDDVDLTASVLGDGVDDVVDLLQVPLRGAEQKSLTSARSFTPLKNSNRSPSSCAYWTMRGAAGTRTFAWLA